MSMMPARRKKERASFKRLISVGNSKGMLISKEELEALGVENEDPDLIRLITMDGPDNTLIVKAITLTRPDLENINALTHRIKQDFLSNKEVNEPESMEANNSS
ncbi:MAG: hypothetical protein EOP04_07130 [Proteobacteria bacterium]|nr:MAG: hypothetical protein EOP04_07130 [Pseudomonadota bacterium]